MKLAVSEDPHCEHPMSYAQTRATAVYAAGKNKEYAKYFMAFLASEAYNMNIVVDADALPPNPEFTKTEAFLRPPDRPEEWQHPWGSVHGVYADIMEELGVPLEFSPFVLDVMASRIISETTDKFMNKMLSSRDATALMQKLINDELRLSLLEDSSKVPLYEERLARQKEIDRLKANGEKIPLSWITNPYWRKWHTLNNLVDETK